MMLNDKRRSVKSLQRELRILEWVRARKQPGVMGAAYAFAVVAVYESGSWWPALVWLLSAFGARFDIGWNRNHQ